ncbi:MAG: helix-turn-helix domain-containing protein, partial [Bacteroidales bacterium]|nr:helix-turn-helix domain-containing protein [Bacteroidales bacterium]
LVFFFSVLFIALSVYFLARSNKLLNDYKKEVRDVFSNSDSVDLKWLRKLILFFYTCYALTFLASGIIAFSGISLAFTDYFYYFMMVVFVFLIGYWGHQQGSVFNLEKVGKIDKEIHPDEKRLNNLKGNGKSFVKEATELKRIMHDEKPYLEPMLTIHDLAKRIDIPAHQLSKLIHTEFGKNFYEFVNFYRIESFKEKVVSGHYQHLTLLAIAFDCGFNSKSAFNRIFKEQTGYTPRDYKMQAKSGVS